MLQKSCGWRIMKIRPAGQRIRLSTEDTTGSTIIARNSAVETSRGSGSTTRGAQSTMM
nr:MAG TPA: hypothetical protein [Caudoviricetes sp.]